MRTLLVVLLFASQTLHAQNRYGAGMGFYLLEALFSGGSSSSSGSYSPYWEYNIINPSDAFEKFVWRTSLDASHLTSYNFSWDFPSIDLNAPDKAYRVSLKTGDNINWYHLKVRKGAKTLGAIDFFGFVDIHWLDGGFVLETAKGFYSWNDKKCKFKSWIDKFDDKPKVYGMNSQGLYIACEDCSKSKLDRKMFYLTHKEIKVNYKFREATKVDGYKLFIFQPLVWFDNFQLHMPDRKIRSEQKLTSDAKKNLDQFFPFDFRFQDVKVTYAEGKNFLMTEHSILRLDPNKVEQILCPEILGLPQDSLSYTFKNFKIVQNEVLLEMSYRERWRRSKTSKGDWDMLPFVKDKPQGLLRVRYHLNTGEASFYPL